MATNESGAPTCYRCRKTLTATDTLLAKAPGIPLFCRQCAVILHASDYLSTSALRNPLVQHIAYLKAQEEQRNAQSSERTDMVRLVNCTPHPVTIFVPDGEDIIMSLPASRQPARVMMTTSVVALLPLGDQGIPVCHSILGPCFDLPEPEPDRYYIVSRIVAQTCPGRGDLLFPDQIVRDPTGAIIGCRALARIHDGREASTDTHEPKNLPVALVLSDE